MRVPARGSVLAIAMAGCVAAPLPDGLGAGASAPAAERLVPPGHGSLRQEEITLTLNAGDTELKVTPLEEWVIRLTAPDTWSRLSSLAGAHRDRLTRDAGGRTSLFLVSFFSRVPATPFRPNDVELLNRGRRHRVLAISPVTPGWGTERLVQEDPQLAVYAFTAELDLEQRLSVEYDLESVSGWDEILRVLEAEGGRARARAGLASP